MDAAAICGQIRARLATLGTLLGFMTNKIAAIARANNLTLVADNLPLVGND